MPDVLRSSISAISLPGGVSTDTARLYITQRFVNPSAGVTGLNTDPASGATITVGANATSSTSPVTLTVSALSIAMKAGDVIRTAGGVNLIVNADAAASATSLQVKKLPVNLSTSDTLTFFHWVTTSVRGALPNFAGAARTATQDTSAGQLSVFSGENDQAQTIEVFDGINTGFVNALDRASANQGSYLGYMLFFPAIGGDERKVITGYFSVGSQDIPLDVNGIARYVYNVQRFGKPVHDERQA